VTDSTVNSTASSIVAPGATAQKISDTFVSTKQREMPLVFKGTASEYFRIWIVNLALTLATLGIYSAWAKVRRVRYLYGNTYLDSSSFEYLADPRRILNGRIIAAVLIVIWFVIFSWGPVVLAQWSVILTAVSYVLFLIITPFFFYKALRFRLFSTAHRSMRFGFSGNLKQSFLVNGMWLALGFLSGFLLYPVYVRRRINYLANNARIGSHRFNFTGKVKALYAIYAQFVGLFVLFLIIFLVFFLMLFIVAGVLSGQTNFDVGDIFFGDSDERSINSVIESLLLFYLIFIFTGSFCMGFLKAKLTNYTLQNLSISKTRFDSRLRGRRLGWIYFSNLGAVLLSVGLLGPWAKIRATRYRIENITVISKDDINAMVAFDGLDHSAFGEEAAGMFDMDFGL